MRTLICITLIAMSSCTVTEDMIANKNLYCSEVYVATRSLARAAGNAVLGTQSIPDVCKTIDEVVEADTADKSDQES